MKIFFLASSLPLIALIVVAGRDWPRKWVEWKIHVQTVLLLFLVGAYAANPFLSGRALGSGEAYNYSLAIADGVTQFRAGVFPIFVGQSEFAFNGRIHPLRTAPYFVYTACALDLVTGHRLNFWELQDLLLTLSLIGGSYSAYVTIRYLIGSTRRMALACTSLFILSPSILAVTYSMDLFMTVTTLPFITLAVGCSARSFRERELWVYILMGASIGLTWLAHPPIALWISAVTVVLQGFVWTTRRPTLASMGALVAGTIIGLAIAGYSFASTLTMREGSGLTRSEDYSPMLVAIQQAFPASLLPVSSDANTLSDFQLGYPIWLLLVISFIAAVVARRLEAIVLTFISAFLLILTIPVPHVTWWIWLHLPPLFPNLTNIWPMQRLYAIATLLIIIAAATLAPEVERWQSRSQSNKKIIVILFSISLIWTLWEAQPFLHAGNHYLKGKIESQDLHRSENIDLTVISYAMLGVPSYFNYGVVDAERWFRVLRDSDHSEAANNWSAVEPGPLKNSGEFRPVRVSDIDIEFAPTFRLHPNKRYQLVFDFETRPFQGVLVISGTHFSRQYTLPSSDQPRGFGMKPGNQNDLILWTTNAGGEEVHLTIDGPNISETLSGPFARFRFYEIDPAQFPVHVKSWMPLRGTFHAAETGWLETPRRYLPGYAASVDGIPTSIAKSPEDAMMLHVPAGDHTFELKYVGLPPLRIAFWISFATILALSIGLLVRVISVATRRLRQHPIS